MNQLKRVDTVYFKDEINEAFNITQERYDEIMHQMDINTKAIVDKYVEIKMPAIKAKFEHHTHNGILDVSKVSLQAKKLNGNRTVIASIPENTTDQEYLFCMFLVGANAEDAENLANHRLSEAILKYVLETYGEMTLHRLSLAMLKRLKEHILRQESDEDDK